MGQNNPDWITLVPAGWYYAFLSGTCKHNPGKAW